MKRIAIVILLSLLTVIPLMADPLISLAGSNQNQSTMGFEYNEYDALVNALQFEKIGGNRLFVALDVNSDLLGDQFIGSATKGFNAGLVLGVPLAPRFMLDYADASYVQTEAAADNTNVTREGYNLASGRYATITEDVAFNPTYIHNRRELVAHAGLVVSPGIALALQAVWDQNDYDISSIVYTNEYEDAAAISPAALTSMGDRTETSNTLPGTGNALAFQLQAGLTFGQFSSLVSLGAGFRGLAPADASYRVVQTVYDEGIDFTLRDSVYTETYSGAYLTDGSAVTALLAMGASPNYSDVRHTAIVLDAQNKLAMGNGLELAFPAFFGVSLYGEGIASVRTQDSQAYDDTLGADASYNAASTVTVITTLDADYSLDFGAGAALKKIFQVAADASFYAGAELDLSASMDKGSVARTQATRTVVDINSDGTLTAGTDTDVTVLLDGYEEAGSYNGYTIGLSVPLGVTYAPFPKLSFHAGCNTTLNVGINANTTLNNSVGDYTYSTFTDALTPANSTVRQQINGTDDNATNRSWVSTSFSVGGYSAFGFTLKISEKFSIDAIANSSYVSFSGFSIIGSVAF